MFGILKKKLKESVQKLTRKAKVEEPEKEIKKQKPLQKIPEKKAPAKKTKRSAKGLEEVKKEIQLIEQEQTGGRVEEQEDEEIKEEIAEEESEEEAESVREPITESVEVEPEEKIQEELHIKLPVEGKKSFRERLFGKVKFKALSEKDIDDFFNEIEPDLLSANIAVEVTDFLRKDLKESLIGKEASRLKTDNDIKEAFSNALIKVLDQGKIDFEKLIKKSKSENKPAVAVFLGFNGSGKTTSIAKLANYLSTKGYKVVMAAGDTFRAAAIDQLEIHGERIGVKVIKHQYGSDSAAVIFDAVKHAQSKGIDIVLADTAGRTHTNTNLVDELKKVIRVNKPDLKVLVIDGLTGNDAVDQAKQFNSDIGVDAVVITKVDVDEKGGAILSVAYSIKKPIIFLGVGQGYQDFKEFDPKEFVKSLLE